MQSWVRFWLILQASLLTAVLFTTSRAELSFNTHPADIPDSLRLQVDLGAGFSHLEKDDDLISFPAVRIRFSSAGLVELQADYEFLYRTRGDLSSVYGSGDLTLWTKVRFTSQNQNNFASFGLRFGVKLPNANDKDGLGTDQTDFFAALLLSRKSDKFQGHINLGIAILDDPFKLRSQQDMMLLGLAGMYNISQTLQIVADFYTQQGASTRFRFSKAAFGARFTNGNWGWQAGVKKGIRADDKGYQGEQSLDWGLTLGVSRYLDLN